jgi:hypothetical protein
VASAAIPEQQQSMAHSGPLAQISKTWKSKPGANLTKSEKAVLAALNDLWPNGDLDHKAKARDRRITERLTKNRGSSVAPRTIQRALKKLQFG